MQAQGPKNPTERQRRALVNGHVNSQALATVRAMAELRVEHVFECSEETFWTKVFFDDDYNRRLFQDLLKFPLWRVAKTEDTGTEVRRTIEASPPIGDLPGPLKAVVGESAGYE